MRLRSEKASTAKSGVKQQFNTLGTLRYKKTVNTKQCMKQQQRKTQVNELKMTVKKMNDLLLRAKGINSPFPDFAQIQQTMSKLINHELLQHSETEQQMRIQEIMTRVIMEAGDDVMLRKKWSRYLVDVIRRLYGKLEDEFCLQMCINCGRVYCTVICMRVEDEELEWVEQAGMRVLQMIQSNFPFRHIQQTSSPEQHTKHILQIFLQFIKHQVSRANQQGDCAQQHPHLIELSHTYMQYLNTTLSLPILQLLVDITDIKQVKQQVVRMIWSSVQPHQPITQMQGEVLTIILCQHSSYHTSNSIQAAKKWMAIYWHQFTINQAHVCLAMQRTLSTYINHHTAASILSVLMTEQPTTGMDNNYLKKTVGWAIDQAAQWGWASILLCIHHIQTLILICTRCFWCNGDGQEWMGADSPYMAALLLFIDEEIAKRVYFGNNYTSNYVTGRRYLSVRLLVHLCTSMEGICKDDTLIMLQYKALKWIVDMITTDYSNCTNRWMTCMLLMAQLVYAMHNKSIQHAEEQINQMIGRLQQIKMNAVENNEQVVSDGEECCRYLVWMYCNQISNQIAYKIGGLLFRGFKITAESVEMHPFTSAIHLMHIMSHSNPNQISELVSLHDNHIRTQTSQLILLARLLSGAQVQENEMMISKQMGCARSLMWLLSRGKTNSQYEYVQGVLGIADALVAAWGNIQQMNHHSNSQTKTSRTSEQNTNIRISINQVSNKVINDVLEQALGASTMCILIVGSYLALYCLVLIIPNMPSQADAILTHIYNLNVKLIAQLTHLPNKINPHQVWDPLVNTITRSILSILSITLNSSPLLNQSLRKLFNCIINQFMARSSHYKGIVWAGQAEQIHKQVQNIIKHHQIELREVELSPIQVVRIDGKARAIRKVKALQQNQ